VIGLFTIRQWPHPDYGGMVLLYLTFKLVPEPPIENEMESLGFKDHLRQTGNLSEIKKDSW